MSKNFRCCLFYLDDNDGMPKESEVFWSDENGGMASAELAEAKIPLRFHSRPSW